MNLTIERIIAGYKASNLTPKTHMFAEVIDGVQCGCAISAVIIGEGHATFEEWQEVVKGGSNVAKTFPDFMQEVAGFDSNTVWDFMYGFDASPGMATNTTGDPYFLGVEAHQKIFVEKVLENDN